MTMIKKTLSILTLAMAGFIVGVVLCEVLVRLLAPQRLDSALDLYVPDPELVFKLRPNYRAVHSNFEFTVPIETNSLGLRNKEIGPKSRGTYRILGLGDSFSFANGVTNEETYFKRLERCLNSAEESPRREVEVVNCAVPANSLVQELRFLKKYGRILDADAVLLGFYVGNDFIDSYELFDKGDVPLISVRDHHLYSLKERDEEQSIIRNLTAPGRQFLAVNSHLYIFLRNRSSELLSRMGLRAPPPPPEFCSKEYSRAMQEGWEVTTGLLSELSSFCRSSNLDLYVVVLPTIYQVNTKAWSTYVSVNRLDSTLYDLGKPQEMLRSFCLEYSIPCVDVLSTMRKAGQDLPLFFPVDSHMNREGHRVVADSLCSFLASPVHDHKQAVKAGLGTPGS